MWPHSHESADLVTFTEKNLKGKHLNFCAVTMLLAMHLN